MFPAIRRAVSATTSHALRHAAPARTLCAVDASTVATYTPEASEHTPLAQVNEAELARAVSLMHSTGVSADDLYPSIAEEAIPRMNNFSMSDLAQMTWAFHRGGLSGAVASGWWAAVQHAAAARYPELMAYEVAAIASVVAAEDAAAPGFFQAAADDLASDVAKPFAHSRSWADDEVLRFVEAVQETGLRMPELCSALGTAVEADPARWDEAGLKTIHGVLSVAGCATPGFLAAVARAPAARAAAAAEINAINTDGSADANAVYTVAAQVAAHAGRAVHPAKLFVERA